MRFCVNDQKPFNLLLLNSIDLVIQHPCPAILRAIITADILQSIPGLILKLIDLFTDLPLTPPKISNLYRISGCSHQHRAFGDESPWLFHMLQIFPNIIIFKTSFQLS